MKSSVKVSICIPAYENSEGIKRLLDSVRVQKYTDYEVVITDDSSSDDVAGLVEEYRHSEDPFAEKISYEKNEVRLGASNNWNRSMELSHGEYIKIMHHDDWFSDENSLGEFVRMLDENPEAVMAFSGTNQVGEETYSRAISDEDLANLRKDYRYLYISQAIGAPSATIYRRTDIRFNGELTWLMDAEFYMNLLRDNNHFAYTKEPLISIGVSSTQLTESVRDDAAINIFEYEYIAKEFGFENEEPFAAKLREVKSVNSTKNRILGPVKTVASKVKAFDLKYIGKICFYIGLTIELLVLILEKSSYVNPVESWMFRIAFVFFLGKCVCTKYSLRDWILIAVLAITSVISYRINTKDEMVRIAVFVVAMKDMDLKRTLKYVFWVTLAGMAALILLSFTGLLGTVVDLGDGYGFKEGMTRLCLGLGSSNTLAIMTWAVMILGIYLYHEKMKTWHYLALLALSCAVYFATLTRTTLATMILTVLAAMLMSKVKGLRESKWVYILGEVCVGVFVIFSIWSAVITDWSGNMTPFQNKINDLLTGRIECISRLENGGGAIGNWLLFSNPGFEEYFDMGYVRMFFWYGIIPATLMILILMYMIYESYRTNDYMGFVLIMMFAFFTVFEAHIVSVYIARNYLLFLAGAYLFTTQSTSLRRESSK